MVGQLKQHEKTFAKFAVWALKQHGFVWDGEVFRIHPESYYYIRPISNRELISLLVEFCDSEGYYIQLKVYYNGDDFAGMYYDIDQVHTDRYIIHDDKGNVSRIETTKEAVLRVFKLMEKEL